MDIEQEYSSQMKKNHAGLLRLVEKYWTPICQCLVRHPIKYGKRTARMLLELKDRIDDCPLYAFSHSADCRSIELSNKRIRSVLPPMPSRGCIIATAYSAVFLEPIEHYEDSNGNKIVENDTERFLSVRAVVMSDFDISTYGMESKPVLLQINLNVVKSVDDTYQIQIPLSIQLCAFTDSDIQPMFRIMTTEDTKVYTDHSFELVNGTFKESPLLAITDDLRKQGMMRQDEDIRDTLQNLQFTDLPIHYVVEERPAHIDTIRKKRAKAARFDDRERWIILDPEAVKKSMKNRTDLGGTHSSPSLHLRGAHNRELKHECFTKMRGTILRIRPTWIGDRSWGVKRTKYKVISRLGASKMQA